MSFLFLINRLGIQLSEIDCTGRKNANGFQKDKAFSTNFVFHLKGGLSNIISKWNSGLKFKKSSHSHVSGL